jgi:RNA polymerase sigma-70 factor (ECF subfamily)
MAPRRASEARREADLDFERLYAGHRGDVFRAALRELGNVHDAEDVTQAAFIDAYRAVLRGSRPEAPRAWLLAIAENVRRRRFRTALRRPREEPLDPEAVLAAEPPTTEQTNALRNALGALPTQQRDVFLLREIIGLSYDEIAEELGSTVGAVQMLLFRARQTLRAELEPPVVARRRGVIVPLPGWLTTFATRSDAFVLTPRAAGALGAAVLAVTGVSAVTGVKAGLAESPPNAPSPRIVQRSTPVASARKPQARPVTAVAQTRGAPARPARPQRSRAVSTASEPQRSPVAAATPITTAAAEDQQNARQVPAAAASPRPLPAVVVEEVVTAASPATSVVSAAQSAAQSAVQMSPVPQPAVPPLEQAGAADAAGAGVPPLPALPPHTLPPVP